MEHIFDTKVNNGSVKWFRNSLGYAFITYLGGENQGKDLFVHHSGIQPTKSQYKTLQQGEYVTFSVTNGANGPQAVQVKGIGGGPLMCDYWHDKKEQSLDNINQQLSLLTNLEIEALNQRNARLETAKANLKTTKDEEKKEVECFYCLLYFCCLMGMGCCLAI